MREYQICKLNKTFFRLFARHDAAENEQGPSTPHLQVRVHGEQDP